MANAFNKSKESCNFKAQITLIKTLANRLIFKNDVPLCKGA